MITINLHIMNIIYNLFMNRLISYLSSTIIRSERGLVEPIWDLWKHISYTQEKVHSLKIWQWNSPLAEVWPKSIKIWDTAFRVPTNGFPEVMIDYWLAWPLGSNMWRESDFPGNISLNHMGVCINTSKPPKVIERLQNAVRQSAHRLYEDPAWVAEDMRWLFIGDRHSGNPMFEVVLPSPKLQMNNHFQIDVDTDAPQAELDAYFRWKFGTRKFFDWQLEVDGVWKVLQMWTIWNMDEIDVRLGIWNNKRSREAHRDSLVELI